MPKGFTAAEKDAIRAELLAAAEQHFAAHGLKKTSVAELAALARISTGAFYAFFESKEALFLAVAERTEQRYRTAILAALALPGPTPRARLTAAFRTAFDLLQASPLLRVLTSSDYATVFRRVPPDQLQAHLDSDQRFMVELAAAARAAGLPLRVPPADLGRLLYPLVLAALHADELDAIRIGAGLNLLLDLAAAYCLGEIKVAHAPRRQRARRG